MSPFARRLRQAAGFKDLPLVKPNSSNTGVPAGTSLTVHNGDLTILTAGTVVEGLDVRGFVFINANNVTFRKSIVKGRAVTSNQSIIEVQSGVSGVLIEDVTIAPTSPSVYCDGIWGGGYHARRLNIQGVVDGAKVESNTLFERSYVHDLAFFSSDPDQGGGPTHNDGIQILRGDAIRLYSNNLEQTASDNAAVQVTQDYGAVTNLVIEANWLDGGGATLNIAHKVLSSLNGVTVKNNRFGRNSYYNAPILISTKTTITNINNVWDDTGQIVPVQQHD